MFSNLKIGQRLIALIALQAIILLFVGLISVHGLRSSTGSTLELDSAVSKSTQLGYVIEPLRYEVMDVLTDLNSGVLGWNKAEHRFTKAQNDFEVNWNSFYSSLNNQERSFVDSTIVPHLSDVDNAITVGNEILSSRDSERLSSFTSGQLRHWLLPFISTVQASIAEQDLVSKNILFDSQDREKSILIITLFAFITGIFVSGLLGILIYQSISNPIHAISETVKHVSEGNISARTNLIGSDELAILGQTFDDLLEDKMESLDKSDKENRVLNESIINLLRAVSRLSNRDLTVNLPVTEDVTGPLADAINKLTKDTSGVLAKVTSVAERVEKASLNVDSKANLVKNVAMNQQQDLAKTAKELAQASMELTGIVKDANQCNQIAEQAGKSTETASSTVMNTLQGMTNIREKINEAGKRIKRLGERSQEIGRVVDLIKDVAERTHVLALNSSVQAAAAGEAGRGFAVIAEEVQRLAENAKRATADISMLVKNIQIETNDTMATMEKTIEFVVNGSRLAESAGSQMTETRQITDTLVTAVKEIAANTERQANISTQLRDRAQTLNQSTQDTAKELDEQLLQTRSLTDFCEQLTTSVKIFKLPDNSMQA